MTEVKMSGDQVSTQGRVWPGGRRSLGRFVLRFAIITAVVFTVIALLLTGGDLRRLAAIADGLAHARFAPHWPNLALIADQSPAVKIHLATIAGAVIVGTTLMLGVKGNRLHRTLGWLWVGFMVITAAASLFIREVNHGQFSFLHLFSGYTLLAAPLAVSYARKHKVLAHSQIMAGLYFGALGFAGLFAFAPGRLMYQVFFG